MAKSNRDVYFATCAPGFETLLFAEARELRFARIEQQVGGIYFEGNRETSWLANLHFRTAIRIPTRLIQHSVSN